MHLIQKPSTWPLVTVWLDTHLCCEWGSYGTHTISHVLLCLCGVVLFLRLRRVFLAHLALDFYFILWFVGTFPWIQIYRSKVSLLQFKFLFDLDIVSIGYAKRGDVQELHLVLDVLL